MVDPADEITTGNVKNLRPDFSFSLAVNKGQEAAPIVADNTMYIVTAYPNIVYALDLPRPLVNFNWQLQTECELLFKDLTKLN